MTIQDRIDEIINRIENLILLHLDGEEQETVLGLVEELGWQWQQTNAHARAMTVCAAVLAGKKWNPEERGSTDEEISQLESIGTQAMIHAVGMPVYSGLVQYFLPVPDAAEDEEEEEEEDGEGGGRMRRDPEIPELYPHDEHFDYTEACRAIAAIVQATKEETGAEKVSVTIRISPDGTHVTVEPWEPMESDAVALLKALAGKVVEIREKGAGE